MKEPQYNEWQETYNIIPTGKQGDWEVCKQDGEISLQRLWFDKPFVYITSSEVTRGTHNILFKKAHGSVLIGGLGVGLDVVGIRDKPKVKIIDVIEIESNVIKLVAQHIINSKVTVINNSVLNYMNATEKTYDIIWFDIFMNDPSQCKNDCNILENSAKKILNPGGEILFWRHQPEQLL